MSARPSFLESAAHLALFSTVCATAYAAHYLAPIKAAPKTTVKDTRSKLVVVTGCDRGFGRLLAEQELCDTDGKPYLFLALTRTEDAAQELRQLGRSTLFALKCDVTSTTDIEAAVTYTEQEILNSKQAVLFALINNAGIADPGDFLFYKDLEIFSRVMDVNFMGQVRVTQAFVPLILRTSRTLATGARILNLSSVCGASANPSNSAYNASKFAVEAWSDSLRLELEQFGVNVVKIRPGQISTDIQSDWAKNYLKNYDAASDYVKGLYGGDAFRSTVEKTLSAMASGKGPAADPQLVIKAIQEILQLPDTQIKSHYWIGMDAHTLWKALHSLPTHVADNLKRLFRFTPKALDLPPLNVVSHVTIDVSSLEKALPFYQAFGLELYGPTVQGQQFLQSGTSKSGWPTLVLLRETKGMPTRGECWHAGMTRLAILTTTLDADVEQLSAAKGLEPIVKPVKTPAGSIAVYKDPDGFTIYLIQFENPIQLMIRGMNWWNRKKSPNLLHFTINLMDAKKAISVFEELGFEKVFDSTEVGVQYDMLPAFNIPAEGSHIERIRGCKLPGDSFWACLMQWVKPETVCGESQHLNAMTISVADVFGALEKAKKAGLIVKEEPQYRTLPLYGEVLVGTAFVEEGRAKIEFCSFANRKS